MEKDLLIIINEEKESINKLLELLKLQFSYIAKEDLFALEKLVDDIKLCNKSIAEWEVKRRGMLNGKSMPEFVSSCNDAELKERYNDIQNLLELVIRQKDTNDLLLKQRLTITNQILQVINPNRDTKTYNSYGKIRR